MKKVDRKIAPIINFTPEGVFKGERDKGEKNPSAINKYVGIANGCKM